MKLDIEDYLIDEVKRKYDLSITFDDMDAIIDRAVDVAQNGSGNAADIRLRKETIPYSVLFPPAGHSESRYIHPARSFCWLRKGRRKRLSSRNSTNGRRGFFGSRPISRISGFGVRKTVCQRRVALLSGKAVSAPGLGRQTNSVRYKGRCFEVVCTSPDKARELMKSWYREHAKLKFTEYAEPIIPDLHGTELLQPHSMFRRWKTVGAAAPPRGKSF